MSVKCAECGSVFKNVWNLKRHVSKKHPDKISQLVPQIYKNNLNYKFSCDVCGRNFNKMGYLNYHRKSHGILQEKNSHKCPLCEYGNPSKKVLITHFQEVHNIEIVSKCRNFTTRQDFNDWKFEIERESNCKYVKVYSKLVCGKTYTHYACHRSGIFTSKGKGIRPLKMKGSYKIDAFCPAYIRLLQDEDGKCCTTFILNHVGHTNDLDNLYLTSEERNVHLETIVIEISSSNHTDEQYFEEKKAKTKEKLLDMVKILENINTTEELHEFEKIIAPIDTYLGSC